MGFDGVVIDEDGPGESVRCESGVTVLVLGVFVGSSGRNVFVGIKPQTFVVRVRTVVVVDVGGI